MKPRNKFENRVAELNATLSEDIAVKDVNWIKREGRKVDWGTHHYCYFTICTNIAEFDVKRLYRAYKYTDNSTDHYFFVEIMREFSDGKRKLYFGKQRTMGCYYDCFLYGSEIELRNVCTNYAGYDITDLFGLSCGSHRQSKGERVKCERIDPKEIARVICNNPVAETFYKQGDPMFKHLIYRTYIKETCRAYTIAKRHGLVFNEETTPIWLDMVYAIIICKKDWHNPVYIAPENLQETHDRFIRMMIRKQQEIKIAREYNRIQREVDKNKEINEKYIKRRKRFYDMVLTDGLIECTVLRDVDAFAEEGLLMQHCVFKCRYFEKPYSLILSARINGERLETIEVDLTNYSIKQCYGKHNQLTIHHKRILDLVNKKMDVIKAYNRNRRKTKIKIAV